MNTAPLRVAVQSTRRLVRDALAACLAARPDLTVVGRTARCSDLLELCLLRRPGALLVEAAPDCEWLDTIATVHTRHPDINIVVVYHALSPTEMVGAYRAGVTTLVPYSRGLDTVLAALRTLPVPRNQNGGPQSGRGTPGALTDRELEIVLLICSGHSVREVAAVLGISPRTVENHKRRIYDKLGVHSQSQAVAHVAQLGLVPPAGGVPPAPGPKEELQNHPFFAVVRGRPGPVRDTVASALAAGGVAFAINLYEAPEIPPRITVLVDPEPDDWSPTDTMPVVLVHSGSADQAVTADAVLRGADAIVPADRVHERLVPVLAVVRKGCLAMDAGQARALFRALLSHFAPMPTVLSTSVLPELTVREHDILRSIAQGDTVRQTARSLGISVKTVENTQGRLFRKLGARNRAGALAVAHGLGLIEPA